MAAYDALLVLSFGGPEKPDDVIPFLENVLRGRNVPRERMLEVAEHYYHFGGKSPINDENRALIADLEKEFSAKRAARSPSIGAIAIGPLISATPCGKCKLAASSAPWRSSHRCSARIQAAVNILEDIDRARAEAGPGAPQIDKIRSFYNHPLFVEAQADCVREALQPFTEKSRQDIVLLYTAHSVPVAMAESSDYQRQLQETCRLVAEPSESNPGVWFFKAAADRPVSLGWSPISMTFCAMPSVEHIVAVPVGFISDHMEVVYDLDTEARAICERKGSTWCARATVGVHPSFLQMIRELICERLGECEARAVGKFGPSHDVCRADCCPAPARRPSSARNDSSPRAIAQR